MKTILMIGIALFAVGCQSTHDTRDVTEGAANCNVICKNNPEIREYSYKAGGGLPLLLMGGMEERCTCSRSGR